MSNQRNTSNNDDLSSAIQSLIQLNLQIMKNMYQIEIMDFINKPEKLFENQVKLALKNSLLFLDYVRKSFDIFSKILLETNPTISNCQKGMDYFKSATTALSTPDVVIGDVTKSLFSPSTDMDPFDIARSAAQMSVGKTSKKETITIKSKEKNSINKTKNNKK
ncbi:hypothetical protein [Legionella micdadei]|uniref:Phasin domain-containing protein n=1 Tax=Legionella micdadei TaxID=451 RepID=A0A098GIG6_LEGMI|nr:hypothetical protein [Legionella micdadei]ARG97274.1 hypothetical protein B6N58_06145 [Legionella micdadei]ARH00421.1 hypothetical protein B6V88_08285 [Legionella micdadei]KTD28151.1 hypothetical protein Lmic_1262 [Legionella micdadei]NSL16781.1 hypothetical protein [Legionella micdadei]CEG61266.1 protein of unknown function [Legionella micdadei]